MTPPKYKIVDCDEVPSYRYRLDVTTCIQSSAELAILQLNPSTADGTKADPTIGKVSCWAKENNFGRVIFLNLFGFRTAKPSDLIGKSYADLVGTRNDSVTESVLRATETIIFAWGEPDAKIDSHYKMRIAFLKNLLGDRQIYAVGEPVSKAFPRHGRMWNGKNRFLRPFRFE
jgi:hypothetical protein